MKKIVALIAAAAMASMMAGCGQNQETLPKTTIQETTPAVSVTEATVAATEETALPEDLPLIEDTTPVEDGVFADNFSVDSASAESYAKQIQSAVANQDLEALAGMAAYPIYIGFADGGASVNNAQEMLDLGAERIFTAELTESIEGAQTAGLTPSKAGFSLSTGGTPNIIFGVRDGALAILGINY